MMIVLLVESWFYLNKKTDNKEMQWHTITFGKIVNTQGLQGEFRVLSVTDFMDERFKKKSVLALFDDR